MTSCDPGTERSAVPPHAAQHGDPRRPARPRPGLRDRPDPARLDRSAGRDALLARGAGDRHRRVPAADHADRAWGSSLATRRTAPPGTSRSGSSRGTTTSGSSCSRSYRPHRQPRGRPQGRRQPRRRVHPRPVRVPQLAGRHRHARAVRLPRDGDQRALDEAPPERRLAVDPSPGAGDLGDGLDARGPRWHGHGLPGVLLTSRRARSSSPPGPTAIGRAAGRSRRSRHRDRRSPADEDHLAPLASPAHDRRGRRGAGSRVRLDPGRGRLDGGVGTHRRRAHPGRLDPGPPRPGAWPAPKRCGRNSTRWPAQSAEMTAALEAAQARIAADAGHAKALADELKVAKQKLAAPRGVDRGSEGGRARSAAAGHAAAATAAPDAPRRRRRRDR